MRLTPTAMRVAIGAGVLLLAGCGSRSGDVPCTLIGADPGVTFWYVGVVGRHPDPGTTVKTCVGTMCQHLTIDRGHQVSMIHVAGRGMDASPLAVSLTVVDASGRRLFQGHTTVQPTEEQPNGPGCEPDVWVARVDAIGRHRLSQVK